MKFVLIAIIALLPIISNATEWLPIACGTGSQYRTPQDDLNDAIKSHDILKVQSALQIQGVKTNYNHVSCAPPIFVAISEGQSDILNLLVHAGADINSVMHISDGGDSKYRTPLMWAAYEGQTQLVKEILNYPQVRVNDQAQYYNGETALFLAVAKEHYDAAILIANRPEVDVNIMVPRYWQRTPLLVLLTDVSCKPVYGGSCLWPKIDLNLVSILAQKSGSFINSDVPHTRPIRDAVWSKNDGVVDALLTSEDLDLFSVGKSGSSGLDEAIWVDNAYAVSKIIARSELPAGLLEKYVTNFPKVSQLSSFNISLAFAALFESPKLDPNTLDANGKSLLERYADQPKYVFPLLKNPKIDININNGGPLRAANLAYVYGSCAKNSSDAKCKEIATYINELKKLGAQ